MTVFSKKAKQVIIRPVPDQLIKDRPGGGGKNLSYLSGSTITDMLNEAFEYLWSWEQTEQWIQKSEPKFNANYDKEPKPQGPVAHVKGKLTAHIPQEDGSILHIIKTGYGSKAVQGTQMDQESVFKAAGTDALKKAASLFGIGLELYRDEDEQEFFDEMNYEDPWTEELLEQYKEQRDYIKSFMEDNELIMDDMEYYFETFSDGAFASIEYIVPENIEAFVAFLAKQLEEAEAE
ncbi:Rad52/Rad22 family DNA repair protein [Bacillus spizizenii]|nr:RAD52 family DNA repair protein [Bacillus spizizenii]MCY8890436.1 RAD52 family DNA repair protein [Bacillus spizizenii]MEC0841891.1 Rad52/Rad22 family DNA repair protein [Bacillus spizizenii]